MLLLTDTSLSDRNVGINFVMSLFFIATTSGLSDVVSVAAEATTGKERLQAMTSNVLLEQLQFLH